MWNAGDVPAPMIEVISPAGSENFFHELSELLSGGAPDNADIGRCRQLRIAVRGTRVVA